MQENKIILIQLWLGPIPWYFQYHYDTTKNTKGIDFLFVTDQDIVLESENYRVIKTTKEEIEINISARLSTDIRLNGDKKTCDLKASLGDLFSEHITGYEYFGCYDIDTLFGDSIQYILPHLGKYDFISVGGKEFHNRLSGVFLMMRNTKELREIYREGNFIQCLTEGTNSNGYEESTLNGIAQSRYSVKIIDSINLDETNGGKNTYDVAWQDGKLNIGGEEKMLYHFYRKNHTSLIRIGNDILGRYDKKLMDDFYWVFGFTENYSETVHHLMDSISKYSNRKCIIYSINFDYSPASKFQSNIQFIFKRIDIEKGQKDYRGRDENIISCKPKLMIDVIDQYPDSKFIFIDSDIYLTTTADDLYNYFTKLTTYPQINSHIHDVVYYSGLVEGEEWTSTAHILARKMDVEICVFPRRKTNVILFDKRSRWFFEEQLEVYEKYKNTEQGIFALHDEDSANVILSKYQLYDCIHLCDMEDSNYIDLARITDLSNPFHQTNVSEHVILPKNANDIAVFHGMKNSERFREIEKTYGNMVLDCEEMVVYYKDNTIFFEKNSFLTTKQIDENVDFILKNTQGDIVIHLGNQELWRFFTFYVSDIYLSRGLYFVEIVKTNSRTRIYNSLIEI